MSDTQSVKRLRPKGQTDFSLLDAKIIRQFYAGERKEKRRSSAYETKLLQKLSPFKRRESSRLPLLVLLQKPLHAALANPQNSYRDIRQ